MKKRRETGVVFLIIALCFAIIGLGADQGRSVVWLVLAGTFALIGAQQLGDDRT